MQHFPCRRLIAHILLFSHLLSSCGRPSHWRVREEVSNKAWLVPKQAPSFSLEAPSASQPAALQVPLQSVEAVARSQPAARPTSLPIVEPVALCTIHYPISHPLLPSGTTLHLKQDNQGCFRKRIYGCVLFVSTKTIHLMP